MATAMKQVWFLSGGIRYKSNMHHSNSVFMRLKVLSCRELQFSLLSCSRSPSKNLLYPTIFGHLRELPLYALHLVSYRPILVSSLVLSHRLSPHIGTSISLDACRYDWQTKRSRNKSFCFSCSISSKNCYGLLQ